MCSVYRVSERMRRRWGMWSLPVILAAVSCCVMIVSALAAEPNVWHESWEAALAAAQESGKPVYVYIWQRRSLPAEDWQETKEHDSCEKMNRLTLINPQVKQMLRNYVLCALDVNHPANHGFIRQYQASLLPDADHDLESATLYLLPVHLFFNAGGRKAFEIHDYIPAAKFVDVLDTVKLLIAAQNAPEEELKQAGAYARLGHICLELQLYGDAKKSLNLAIELDPENRAGARADAELDLTIMALPDQPSQGYRDLASYLNTYPDSKRQVEVKYFMAVAKYVDGDEGQAMHILEDIANIRTPVSPEEERWINYAAVLLYQLRHEGE